MHTLKFILQKEFLQIFRNKSMLPIIFILPIIQLCVLVFAATYEMKNTNMYIVDQDLSTHSRKMISKFEGSKFFTVREVGFSEVEAERQVDQNEVDAILIIRNDFGKKLNKHQSAEVQLLINAIDAGAAGLYRAYISSVIQEYAQSVSVQDVGDKQIQMVEGTYSHQFNPEMEYIPYMLPGVLVVLVTVIGLFLSAMNIVREKEIGTIEQVNVTPIKKYQFLLGKLIPFLVIGIFELLIGLLIAAFIFQIPFLGSGILILGIAFLYLICILAMGLFISTQTETQQQAMFIAWFFMIIFILMSGLFTPVESMPDWGQTLNYLNPVAYFMKIIRMVLLKGSGFIHLQREIGILSVFAGIMLFFAIYPYRKVR